MRQQSVFAIVRKGESDEFIDINTIDILPELARRHADDDGARIPGWTRDNPIARLAEFRLVEVSP